MKIMYQKKKEHRRDDSAPFHLTNLVYYGEPQNDDAIE